MSFENPTRLRIGMTGEFAGKKFLVAGRMVMGAEADGETYYWNEFNLESKTGDSATLVYDQSEGGGTWRLFTEFEPEYPMTAADVVLKRVSDVINLTGEDVRVTWVGSSRVHRIEGLAPKGLKTGSLDNYFNAELRDTMLVVSWTGRQVEFYQGITLSNQAVANAFALTGAAVATSRLPFNFNRTARLDDGDSEFLSGGKFLIQAAVVVIVFLMIFGRGMFSGVMTRVAPPVKHLSAPAMPLPVGAEGRWMDTKYHITMHTVVEIAEPGVVFERHEYGLADDFGLPSLLVCGDVAGSTDWTFYKTLAPLEPPTPQQAAAKKTGESINVAGVSATITDLFQSTIRRVDAWETNQVHAGDVSFGYLGRSGAGTLLTRWEKGGIRFYQGTKVSPKEFSAAFSTVGQ